MYEPILMMVKDAKNYTFNGDAILVEAKDWTRQNLHVHVEASGEQYRFVMPGAALNEDEFRD